MSFGSNEKESSAAFKSWVLTSNVLSIPFLSCLIRSSFLSKPIAIIGLGYVGLPLAIEFSKKYSTIGFDKNEERIKQLKNGLDKTLEVKTQDLKAAELSFSLDPNDIINSHVYVVTVPTPVDKYNNPDMSPLASASATVGKALSKGDVVIYESTVYPGATEEDCIPVVERVSGLDFNKDFYAGYSPERINPGDKEHRVTNILKVTSGSTPEIADIVDGLYKSIITLCLSVPAVMIDLYKPSTISAISGVEPEVTFKIFVTRCSLSPGLIRSGE
jgi:nucleotide sugar dehydrogenase